MNSQNKKEKIIFLSLILYTILVIVWGAWVRISHSGDGCGDTWPFCHGQLIPDFEQKKTWVEYAHRGMSGIYGIVVFVLFLWTRKLPREHASRKWGLWMFIFTITEAALGAKLVLFGLVGSNDTAFRAFSMSLHMLNSLILVLTTTLCFLGFYWKSNFKISKKSVVVFCLIGITGALAALSTTLFPTQNLLEGLLHDFQSESHFLVRLRVLHPLLAIGLGGYLLWEIYQSLTHPQSEWQKKTALWASASLATQIALGAVTLITLSPIPLKLLHLTLAHVTWVLLIFWMTAPVSISDNRSTK